MKSLILFSCVIALALLVTVGCKNPADYDMNGNRIEIVTPKDTINPTTTFKCIDGSHDDQTKSIFVDDGGCEYISNYNGILTHKGSCKKCRQRDSLLLDKMFFDYIIKTNYEKSEQKMDSTMIIRKTIDSLSSILTGVPK